MKKKICLVTLIAMLMGGGAFAQNHHYGIDISIGTALGEWEIEQPGVTTEASFFQSQLRVGSYNGIWLNHMLGVYASFSAGLNLQFAQKANGKSAGNIIDFGGALDFAVGPCFGIDIGNVRFNVGLGFHVGAFNIVDTTTSGGVITQESTTTFTWMGVALAPQFKFTASRRCSFVIGCDFYFDGCIGISLEEKESGSTTKTKLKDFDSTRRISVMPYLGLGINFGD